MRALLYIGILFSAISCTRNADRLQSGDLLFQVGKNSRMTGAITAATGDGEGPDYSHVGIAVTANGADSVLEAADGGVQIIPLQEFLDRSATLAGRPAVVAMRLRDTTGVSAAVSRARSRLGLPYDYSFLPGNGKLYCSELVWESYLAPDRSHLFPAKPMNFRAADGSLPQFWIDLFARQGEPVPEGVSGTNPNDMAQSPALKTVHVNF